MREAWTVLLIIILVLDRFLSTYVYYDIKKVLKKTFCVFFLKSSSRQKATKKSQLVSNFVSSSKAVEVIA